MLRFCSLRPAISAHYLIYRAEVKAASRAGAPDIRAIGTSCVEKARRRAS